MKWAIYKQILVALELMRPKDPFYSWGDCDGS